MDELIKAIQHKILWYMLFTDDIVLLDETRAMCKCQIEAMTKFLESQCFRLSRSKITYMEFKFNKQKIYDYTIMALDMQEMIINN